jgi:hypothetical protein
VGSKCCKTEMSEKKKEFFRELDELDRFSDGEQECDDIAPILKSTRSTVTNPSASAVIPVSVPVVGPQCERVQLEELAGTREASYSKSGNITNKNETSQKKRPPANPSHAKSGGAPPKKRRVDSIQLVPESQQIFRGLVFCESGIFLLSLDLTLILTNAPFSFRPQQ